MKKPITKKQLTAPAVPGAPGDYSGLVGGIGDLLEAARRASARTVNAFQRTARAPVGWPGM